MKIESLRRELTRGDKIPPNEKALLTTIEPLMQAGQGLNLSAAVMKDLPENLVELLAVSLPLGAVVKFEGEDTSDNIQIFFNSVLGKRTLILDKNAASIIARHMWNTKYEVILRIEDGTIIEPTLLKIVDRLRDNSLELSSETPIATVEKIAQMMSERRSTLFLDEKTTKDIILAASHRVQSGGILELSTNLPLNILIQVAEALNPGVMLQLRNTTISTENIKLLAASLKPRCGLKLKSDMSEKIATAATALRPGVILQLESGLNTTDLTNGIQALQPGCILMLTKYSGASLFKHASACCPVGVKVMLAPSCLATHFTQVAIQMQAGRHLCIATGTHQERVNSIYNETEKGVIIEDYTGKIPKIFTKGVAAQPVLTPPEASLSTPTHGFQASSAMDVRPDSMAESGLACGIRGSNPMDYAPDLPVDQPEIARPKTTIRGKLPPKDKVDFSVPNPLPDAQEGAPPKKICLDKPSRSKPKSSVLPQGMTEPSKNTFFSKGPSSPEVASQRSQSPLEQLLNAANLDRELNFSNVPKRSISQNTSDVIACLFLLSGSTQQEVTPSASGWRMDLPVEFVGSLSVEEEITEVNQLANHLPFG